jgi:hypothetical protein
MACELSVTDCFGRPIELQHATWQSKIGQHPEIAPYHDMLATALTDPDVVVDAQTKGHHFYRSGLTNPPHDRCYLRVVVRYDAAGQTGQVATIWLSSTIDGRRHIWTRDTQRWQ